ncbi:MAG: hypothetical protein IPM15_06065 [Betaproteobacteria bacterium]|nr:hypothetical protein [Betaproteobacteria bacterium]
MSTFTRWLAPVRQLAAAFFRHDVKLERVQGGALHVVLEERKPAAAGAGRTASAGKPDRATADKRRRQEETLLVRTELAALLNELPETRLTMRHLVFVEQAIAKKGLRVLHKIPLDVLQRAHEQLENLVINWSAAGLANLRSKMAVAIIDREHDNPDAEADAYRTAAVLDGGEKALPQLNDALGDELGDELEDALASARRGDVPPRDDDEALAAAYAALGTLAPSTSDMMPFEPVAVELQGELGSTSARELLKPQRQVFADSQPDEISVRVLHTY